MTPLLCPSFYINCILFLRFRVMLIMMGRAWWQKMFIFVVGRAWGSCSYFFSVRKPREECWCSTHFLLLSVLDWLKSIVKYHTMSVCVFSPHVNVSGNSFIDRLDSKVYCLGNSKYTQVEYENKLYLTLYFVLMVVIDT